MIATVDTISSIDLQHELSSRLNAVNDSIERRNQNDLDNITQALRAGRELHRLKDIVKDLYGHGQWYDYIKEHTDYKTPRDAQLDMQLFKSWEPWLTQLITDGVIENADTPENELVTYLGEDGIAACKSAMQNFARSNTPDVAFELAISTIKNGQLTVQRSSELMEFSRALIKLPEKWQDIGKFWYERYEFLNSDVVSLLPKLEGFEQIVEEISKSGYLHVPGINNGQGRNVHIARAGVADFELAIGEQAIETEYQRQADKFKQHIGIDDSGINYVPKLSTEKKDELPSKIIHIGSMFDSETVKAVDSTEHTASEESVKSTHLDKAGVTQNKQFDDEWQDTIVGSMEEILSILQSQHRSGDDTYRIVLYKRTTH